MVPESLPVDPKASVVSVKSNERAMEKAIQAIPPKPPVPKQKSKKKNSSQVRKKKTKITIWDTESENCFKKMFDLILKFNESENIGANKDTFILMNVNKRI